MLSIRSKNQLKSDVTVFFGSLRDYDESNDKLNLGLGEIRSKNNLLNELSQYKDLILRDIIKLIKYYPGCQGYKPLNEKIAELIKLETKEDIDPQQIIITTGTYDAITQALFTYADPGSKVVFPVPSFPYWSNTIRTSTEYKPIYCAYPNIFSNKLGELVYSNIDKDTSTIIINSVHNPLGSCLNREQSEIINDVARKKGIKVILDDVYRTFSSQKWAGKYFDDNNMVIVDSLSKRFGIPGIRVGFAVIPENEVKYFRATVANQYVGVSMLSMVLADYIIDLYLNDRNLNNIPREIERRQEKLNKYFIKIRKLGFLSPKPKAGMFRMLYCNNSFKICSKLKNNDVIVKPGVGSFPDNFSSYRDFIRISVGGEPRIKEAGEKILEVFEQQDSLIDQENLVEKEVFV